MRATVRRQWARDACAVARSSMEVEERKRGRSVSEIKVGSLLAPVTGDVSRWWRCD